MLKRSLVSITQDIGVVLCLGTVLNLGQVANAAPEHRSSFREFRAQNSGLDRRVARHMHRQLVRDDRRSSATTGSGALPNVIGTGTLIFDHSRVPRSREFARTTQLNNQGELVKLANGVHLDLGSQEKSIVLGQQLFSTVSAIDITVGGEKKTLTAGATVTAAEYIAVKQALSGIDQSIHINNSGQATSGEIDLSALTQRRDVMRAGSLVVPSSVTARADFSRRSDFRLLGDLSNFGTVEAIDNGRHRGGSIHAENISNHAGALINSTGNLTLLASSDLTNDGTITSAQNLTLEGNNITNTGTISARKNVTINTSHVKNTGLVSSQAGEISIEALPIVTALPLIIDNSNGTLSALNGAVNIHDSAYAGSQNTYLSGGNVLCLELNLNAGNGTINVNTDQLTGTVNTIGSAAHVTAATETLSIGKTCLTGDPTFYNTAGSIAINGSITVAEALTIVANGDINFNNGSDLIAANATQGFPINVIAGANFTTAGGANQGTLGPIPPTNNNNGGVTINGNSVTGGSINFNSSSGIDTFISTRPTGGNGTGASVLLVAFEGTSGTSGRINTGNPTFDRIFTGGKGNGSNGSVTIIAPKMNNAGVFLPAIDTSGGTGVGGNVSVFAAAPIANNVQYNSAGQLVVGKIVPSATITPNGEVRFVDTTVGQGTVTARGFVVTTAGNTQLTARRVDLEATGTILVLGDVTATSLFTASTAGSMVTEFGAVAGQVSSPISILTSTGSNIGGFGTEFLVTGGTVYADGATGVNIASTAGINIAGGSTTNGSFVVAANGNTTINGDIILGVGSMDISTTSGVLSASAVNLSTVVGNISLSNLAVDKSAKLLLTGTQITALGGPALGDVMLSVGAVGVPVAGKAPKKNVVIDIQSGGQIFFGTKGITTNAPTSNLAANNANIFFNNPINKKNIVLSGVSIAAGP